MWLFLCVGDTRKGGSKIYWPTPGEAGGGAKSFWEEKMTRQILFRKKKMMGQTLFWAKKMTGLGLFLLKKNDGAKTFSHKIYRKNTSAGLLFRIIKWGG